MISLVQFKEDFTARTKMLDWVGGWLSQTRPIPRYLTVIMNGKTKSSLAQFGRFLLSRSAAPHLGGRLILQLLIVGGQILADLKKKLLEGKDKRCGITED